jgi:hypothetical protein
MDNSLVTSQVPNKLAITREQFDEIYPDLVGYYDFFNNPIPAGTPKEVIEQKYFKSKLWRLNNMYTIVDKDGVPVIFRMNFAQHKVYAATRKHPRVIILKSRQQGISTLWLVSYFDDAIWCPHLNLGLMAQGTDEASTLLERAKLLWEELDPSVKAFLNIKQVADNATKFAFSNKSTIFIRVSFRSTTLQRLHISEFGKIANANPKRAKETKTGTLQALGKGNTGVIESTAEGRNEFQFMWDAAVIASSSGQMAEKDFLPVFLPWIDDPDCVSSVMQAIDSVAERYFSRLEDKLKITLTKEQKNFWVIQHRELEDDIYQEYPATAEEAFTASRDGTFYAKLFNTHVMEQDRVIQDLYDPNLDVEVFMDLGVDDYFVMVFVQWYRNEYRIIDEYWNNGYDITHYIDVAESRGYNISKYKFPHDIAVRELAATGGGGKAKSREQIVREYFKAKKIQSSVVKLRKDKSIENGIESVRRMIKSMWIDAKCEYIISCLLNYSKEWDEKLRVWKKTPRHDEYSHGGDVLRGVAQHTVEQESLHESSRAPAPRTTRPSGAAL